MVDEPVLMARRGAERADCLLKRTSNRINGRAREGMTRGMDGAQYNVHQVKFEFMQVKVVLVIALAPREEREGKRKAMSFCQALKNRQSLKERREIWMEKSPGVRKAA